MIAIFRINFILLTIELEKSKTFTKIKKHFNKNREKIISITETENKIYKPQN